jgi:hypothetical protein
MKCTFGGVWNGGGGGGQKKMFVASFFFDRAAEAGFVDPNQPVAEVRPLDFEKAANKACNMRMEEGKSKFPRVEEDNLPYLCLDLVYQYTLLVDGFGMLLFPIFFQLTNQNLSLHIFLRWMTMMMVSIHDGHAHRRNWIVLEF